MNEQSDGITMFPQNLSVINNIVSGQVRLMSFQLMLLKSSIGEMHRQASAQGCRRATNVISTSKRTVFVRTGELVNYIGSV